MAKLSQRRNYRPRSEDRPLGLYHRDEPAGANHFYLSLFDDDCYGFRCDLLVARWPFPGSGVFFGTTNCRRFSHLSKKMAFEIKGPLSFGWNHCQ